MKNTDTLIWVLYDIQKDKSRTKAAKACKEAGLYRVQYSVFLGTIARNRLDELSMMLEDLIDPDVDKIYMFPMCETDFRKVILHGQAFEKKMVRDEVKNLFV